LATILLLSSAVAGILHARLLCHDVDENIQKPGTPSTRPSIVISAAIATSCLTIIELRPDKNSYKIRGDHALLARHRSCSSSRRSISPGHGVDAMHVRNIVRSFCLLLVLSLFFFPFSLSAQNAAVTITVDANASRRAINPNN
jgi:hypothetical protein